MTPSPRKGGRGLGRGERRISLRQAHDAEGRGVADGAGDGGGAAGGVAVGVRRVAGLAEDVLAPAPDGAVALHGEAAGLGARHLRYAREGGELDRRPLAGRAASVVAGDGAVAELGVVVSPPRPDVA